MTDKQIETWKYLKENADDFDKMGWYTPDTYSSDFWELDEDTPVDKAYFTIEYNNVSNCERMCGEVTEVDDDGEEYTYHRCGNSDCDAVWEESVFILAEGGVSHEGKIYTYEELDRFIEDY